MRTFKMSRSILMWVCALLVLPALGLAAEPQFRTVGYYLTQSGYPVEVRAEAGLPEELADAAITDWQQPDGFLRPDQTLSLNEYVASLATARASRSQGRSLSAGSCTLFIFKDNSRRIFVECSD